MFYTLLTEIVLCLAISGVKLQGSIEPDDEPVSETEGEGLRCISLFNLLLSPQTAIGRLIQSSFFSDEGANRQPRAEIEATLEKPRREVCYEDLGCFALDYPWFVTGSRPINLLPQNPFAIKTHFFLSTRREHGQKRRLLTVRPEVESNWADFDSSRLTVIITHGWNSNAGKDWIRQLEKAVLARTDANVISVDWSLGGHGINYMQSVSNLRVVAAEISRLLNYLKNEQALRPDRVHLIGQSMGAHIMAYVANNVTGISRITGLDPAQPGFEGNDPAVYLDSSDAQFVDIVHSNGEPFVPNGGLGFIEPTGHVDFYMNGGKTQPGCPGIRSKIGPINLIITTMSDLLSTPIEMLVNYASCSHGRAYEYFIEAYSSNCTFWGRKWSRDTPEPANEPCSPDICSALGQFTDLHSARGTLYVKTNRNSPFCIPQRDVGI